MASRPRNIGIKAIEIYFPSQVRLCTTPDPHIGALPTRAMVS